MIIRNRDPFRINTLRAALASVSWDCLSSSLFEEEKIYPQHWLPCHLGLSLFKFVRGSEEKDNAPEVRKKGVNSSWHEDFPWRARGEREIILS
jgi:hypothetical protein